MIPGLEIGIVMAVAFGAAVLTFFSGFGLGTLLTPVMMVFLPTDVAIALTGVVHLAAMAAWLWVGAG